MASGENIFSELAATYKAKLATNVQHGKAHSRFISMSMHIF